MGGNLYQEILYCRKKIAVPVVFPWYRIVLDDYVHVFPICTVTTQPHRASQQKQEKKKFFKLRQAPNTVPGTV